MFRTLTLVSMLLISMLARAQDTLSIRLRQADSLFFHQNLLALAGRYQIEIAQAQVIQAGLYDNPTFSAEINAYNPEKGRALDIGRQGQKFFAIQQLLYTAGKRNKRIALAQESARMTQIEFKDLLRNLLFDLHTRFHEIYFHQQTLQRYNQQLVLLNTTINSFEQQLQRNNVSLKEVVRLKALRLELANNRTEIEIQLADKQQYLQTLLSTSQVIRPIVFETTDTKSPLAEVSRESLVASAYANRPDLEITTSLEKQAQLNLNLQKAMAKPDLTLGAVYDQSSNYITNYFGLSASIDLPLFNRNQGAIKAANSQIGYQKSLVQQKTVQIRNEVNAAIEKVQSMERMVVTVENQFTRELEELNRGILQNFVKGNISLLEFVDFFETYNESVQQLNRLKADRVGAYEELIYVTGKTISY